MRTRFETIKVVHHGSNTLIILNRQSPTILPPFLDDLISLIQFTWTVGTKISDKATPDEITTVFENIGYIVTIKTLAKAEELQEKL